MKKHIAGQKSGDPTTSKGHCIRTWSEAAHSEALLLRASIKQLLDEVVAKRVHHKLDQVLQHFGQHCLDGCSPAFVKLSLQEPAAVLVLGHCHDLQCTHAVGLYRKALRC